MRNNQPVTTAEGVESPAQLHVLQQQGYRFAQGHIFAPAMSSQQFEYLLEAQQSVEHTI